MTVPPSDGDSGDGADQGRAGEPPNPQRYVLTPLPEPAARPPVDGYAITAVVFGLIGGVVFAVGFGIASLRRILRGQRRGVGHVVVAFAASLVWVVVLVAVLTHHPSQELSRDAAGNVIKAGTGPVRIGDCVEIPHDAPKKRYLAEVKPCDQLHNAEVFAIVVASGLNYPGYDTLESDALINCNAELAGFLGKSDTQLRVTASVPTQAQWDGDLRGEACLLVDQQDITGDIRDHG